MFWLCVCLWCVLCVLVCVVFVLSVFVLCVRFVLLFVVCVIAGTIQRFRCSGTVEFVFLIVCVWGGSILL